MILYKKISKLKKSDIKDVVDTRIKEFKKLNHQSTESWFSELCFCILTANSKAHTAIKIQGELGAEGFCRMSKDGVKRCIVAHKHRFHNNKAEYIVGAREHIDIKKRIQDAVRSGGEQQAREWLVKNVKGLGYKEASHFLRNVGYHNVAILDRHVLSLMKEDGLIKEKPKSLAKKNYLELEVILKKLADKLKLSQAELDLYMWYLKTGEVLK